MKYRKKPIVIEAFQFYIDNMPDWFMDKVTSNDVILRKCDYKKYSKDEAYCEIKTLEGVMIANGGDYIIKGVKGELYPCKPDIFLQTYESVEVIKNSYMSFGEAIHALKNGKRVGRKGWDGKGMYLGLCEGGGHRDGYRTQDFVYLKTAQDTIICWNPSQTDMLAVDWEIISQY